MSNFKTHIFDQNFLIYGSFDVQLYPISACRVRKEYREIDKKETGKERQERSERGIGGGRKRGERAIGEK